MNPFRIGDVLCVEFGSRQQMRVVALRYNACLLQLPGGCVGSIWRGVEVLLRLNPDHVRTTPLLPAPRHRYVRVGEQQLSRGDILRDSEGLYEIVGIWRETDRIAPHPKAKYQTRPLRVQYRAQCARIPTGERFQQVFPAHHTMLYWVVGGPKLAAANAGTIPVNIFHILEAAS